MDRGMQHPANQCAAMPHDGANISRGTMFSNIHKPTQTQRIREHHRGSVPKLPRRKQTENNLEGS
jgi:hypothetical protein